MASFSIRFSRDLARPGLFDDQRSREPQRSGSGFIEGATRGERKLRVVRLNGNGDTVAESDEVTIYVLRPSIITR